MSPAGEAGQTGAGRYDDLRQRAEELLRRQPDELREMPPEGVQSLIHELQVHQIELELQNDELRRSQEELELARDRYFDLYDLAPVGYFTLSRKGLILAANLAGAALLGVERGSLRDMPFTHFILPADQDSHYLHLRQVLESQTPQSWELRLVKPGGSPFHTHLECSAARDVTGDEHVRLTVVDISRRVQAEEELRRYRDQLEDLVAERTRKLRDAQEQLVRHERLAVLGQLAGGLGHELRGPLGSMKSAAYLLRMAIAQPDPDVEIALSILEKQVDTSQHIIDSLLGFARDKTPRRREVYINEVVAQAVSSLEVLENVMVIRDLDEGAPVIQADPDQLVLVFLNLVRNAVRAMPDGGRLTVTTRVVSEEPPGAEETGRPGWIAVSVADTGVGIPRENLEKIFEPLFTTHPRGIGLGLALVKMLVEGHGGQVRVESSPGQGTVFTVILPVTGA